MLVLDLHSGEECMDDIGLTLREKILNTIREAIRTGQLKPNQKIVEQVLAEQFGVSRTPVREALRQLEADGYVKVIPRKGVVVAPLSPLDVKEYYDIKGLLESYAAQMAAENMSDSALGRLEEINKEMAKMAEQKECARYSELCREFHRLFLREGGNLKLVELLSQMEQKFNRLHFSELMLSGRLKAGVEHHKALLDAFRQRDGDRAAQVMKDAILLFGNQLLEQMDDAAA